MKMIFFVTLGCAMLSGCKNADNSVTEVDSPSVKVRSVQLPKASLSAQSKHGHWVVDFHKNPVTGERFTIVSESSTKAMYNQYSSDGAERVSLQVYCKQGQPPNLGFFGHIVLRGTDSGDFYEAPIRIDDNVRGVRWIIGKDDDIMTDTDSADNNIVQSLQMGKSVIVTYSAVDQGEQYATFDLTGIRTAMAKGGCTTLTSPS